MKIFNQLIDDFFDLPGTYQILFLILFIAFALQATSQFSSLKFTPEEHGQDMTAIHSEWWGLKKTKYELKVSSNSLGGRSWHIRRKNSPHSDWVELDTPDPWGGFAYRLP